MLTVELGGLADLDTKLTKVMDALDVTHILDESEALLLNRIRDRFLQQINPDLVPWVPSKRVVQFGGSTLFLSGTLFHSIQAYAAGADSREIGTDVPYAAPLQAGTLHMVPREFLGFNQEDVTLVESRVLQRVLEAAA